MTFSQFPNLPATLLGERRGGGRNNFVNRFAAFTSNYLNIYVYYLIPFFSLMFCIKSLQMGIKL